MSHRREQPGLACMRRPATQLGETVGTGSDTGLSAPNREVGRRVDRPQRLRLQLRVGPARRCFAI